MKKFYLALAGCLMFGLQSQAQCDDLFISEYIEGSSSNKALEIYNPTDKTINLSTYSIHMINNGGTANDIGFDFVGTLAPYSVYVIANDAANSTILAAADTAMSYNSVAHFNGDDAIVLIKGTDTIDGIGFRYKDPGSSWTVGSGSTKEYTLVRKATVKSGEPDWNTGAGQWDVYARDETSYLGKHTSDCFVPATPELSFATSYLGRDENSGSAMISVKIKAPSVISATTVEVNISGGTATNGTQFTVTMPQTLTFPAGSSANQSFTVTLNDNSTADLNTDVEFKLSNPSGAAVLGSDSTMLFEIRNDDYRVSTIAGVRTADADLNVTNKNEKVEVTGIVYGIDLDGNAGISFTIMDTSGGINIFNFVDVSDYVVTEGDEITVRGEIDFYNGLTEVKADSIRVNSQNNTLAMPWEVDSPTEVTESRYIKVSKIMISENDTTTVWPSNGNIWFKNESGDSFQVRIDKDAVELVGTPVLYDTMNITGVGGQFVSFAPYNTGYQIFLMRLNDVEQWVDRSSVRDIDLIQNIFPNPTEGSVTVQTVQPADHIVVTDLAGKVMFSAENIKTNNITIDLDNLSKGLYMIQVTVGEYNTVERIMVK